MIGLITFVAGVCLWAGTALLLSRIRWFARLPLAARLSPYSPAGLGRTARRGDVAAMSFASLVSGLGGWAGERLAAAAGQRSSLERRLRRLHAEVDVASFRGRQLLRSIAGAAVAGIAALGLSASGGPSAIMVAGGFALVFVAIEQRVVAADERRRERLRRELPVVAEQIAMLLSAGFALHGALRHVARRASGVAAEDLGRVLSRIDQGVAHHRALREWADLVDVDAVTRLVDVLSLDRHAADLGRLITTEVRQIRASIQRDLVSLIDRRAQQVWIPVTVATLVPGVIFIAVPFTAALATFVDGG